MESDNPPAEHAMEAQLDLLKSVLRTLIEHSPFKLTYAVHQAAAAQDDPEAPEYVVDLSGPDADLLLEKNATLMHALEYVVLKAIRLDEEHFRKISFDCHDWRQTRMHELRLMAQVAAERVIDSGDPFTLSPMNPRERRLIHLALKD
jgi:predicted RNA-binding protein Jag